MSLVFICYVNFWTNSSNNANCLLFSFQDPDTQVGDFQRKMELINSRMTNDRQYRHVQHLGNCKYLNKLTEKMLIRCIVHLHPPQ